MKRILFALVVLLAACGGPSEHPPQIHDYSPQAFGTWRRVSGSGCLYDVTTGGQLAVGLHCVQSANGERIIKAQQTNGTWAQLTEQTLVGISSDGTVMLGVRADGSILRYSPPTCTWQPLAGPQGAAYPARGTIAILNQHSWVISGDGKVYHHNGEFWEQVAPLSPGFAVRISVAADAAITIVTSGCGQENVYFRTAGTNTSWQTVGYFASQGCFLDATGQFPGSGDWWGIRPDGVIRRWDGPSGLWQPNTLPSSAAPYNAAIRIVGWTHFNTVYALGPYSDPQGNLWVNR